VVISKRTPVALLGGHYLYHCEGTDVLPLTLNQKLDKPAEEQRFCQAIKDFTTKLTI
jgi:hypothetical protein